MYLYPCFRSKGTSTKPPFATLQKFICAPSAGETLQKSDSTLRVFWSRFLSYFDFLYFLGYLKSLQKRKTLLNRHRNTLMRLFLYLSFCLARLFLKKKPQIGAPKGGCPDQGVASNISSPSFRGFHGSCSFLRILEFVLRPRWARRGVKSPKLPQSG